MSPNLSVLDRVGASRHPLTTDDLLPRDVYAGIRDSLLPSMHALKSQRRAPLGPHCTLLFENRATAWFQVQEELRLLSRDHLGAVLELLRCYNRLIPEPGELRATLMIDTDQRHAAMSLARALATHLDEVQLWLGDLRLRAHPLEPLDGCVPGLTYVRFVPQPRSVPEPGSSLRWFVPGHSAMSVLPTPVERTLLDEMAH